MRVIVSGQADRDLIEIYVYLHKQRPQSAERVAADIRRRIADIALFPRLGAPRFNVAPSVRSTFVHPYQIFYAIRQQHVEILRVLHGSRDTKKEFLE